MTGEGAEHHDVSSCLPESTKEWSVIEDCWIGRQTDDGDESSFLICFLCNLKLPKTALEAPHNEAPNKAS